MVTPAAERPDRPLRKDAQRSRERVLEGAGRLFAERGLEVGFDEIARAAGVGVGTVYRRFPDRRALAVALFGDRMAGIVEHAEEALGVDDPWQALLGLCLDLVRVQQDDRGLLEVVAAEDFGDEGLRGLRARLVEVVGAVVARAQRAGAVRPDLAAGDVLVAIHLFSRMVEPDAELWQRSFVLFLDAVQAGEGRRPLPTPELDPDDVESIARGL